MTRARWCRSSRCRCSATSLTPPGSSSPEPSKCRCSHAQLTFAYFESFLRISASAWQDHLYVQYVEVAVFQAEYQQLSGKIRENEAIIQSICESGSSLGEVTGELDKLEDMMEVANTPLELTWQLQSLCRALLWMSTEPSGWPRPGRSWWRSIPSPRTCWSPSALSSSRSAKNSR